MEPHEKQVIPGLDADLKKKLESIASRMESLGKACDLIGNIGAVRENLETTLQKEVTQFLELLDCLHQRQTLQAKITLRDQIPEGIYAKIRSLKPAILRLLMGQKLDQDVLILEEVLACLQQATESGKSGQVWLPKRFRAKRNDEADEEMPDSSA